MDYEVHLLIVLRVENAQNEEEAKAKAAVEIAQNPTEFIAAGEIIKVQPISVSQKKVEN